MRARRTLGWLARAASVGGLVGVGCSATSSGTLNDAGSLYSEDAPDGAPEDTGAPCSPEACPRAASGDATSKTDGRPDGAAAASDAARDACARCPRDWATYPAVATFDGISELWAVSDVHGDYAAFTKLLVAGHLLRVAPTTPAAAEWAGGTSTLVIVGDLIDKGPDAPDVVRLASALQAAATVSGGRVVVTLGNHEAEFLANPENAKATASNGLDPELAAIGLTADATAAGDDSIGRFLRQLPVAARIDDWFFVHAGNTQGATVAQLESALENAIDTVGYGAPALAASDSLLETKLGSSPPQWWDATKDPKTLLGTWTTALGAKHLVMGHQPGVVGISGGPNRAKDQLAAEYGGLLFLIDTGLSVDVDDTGGALLHITNAGTSAVAWEELRPDGSITAL